MKKIISSIVFSVLFSACTGNGGDVLPNGEACDVDDDCDSSLCKRSLGVGTEKEIDLPGGICTTECNPSTSEGCDLSHEVCLIYTASGESNCYQRCNPFGDETGCRDGWECYNIGFFTLDFVCIPLATTGRETDSSNEVMLLNISEQVK